MIIRLNQNINIFVGQSEYTQNFLTNMFNGLPSACYPVECVFNEPIAVYDNTEKLTLLHIIRPNKNLRMYEVLASSKITAYYYGSVKYIASILADMIVIEGI